MQLPEIERVVEEARTRADYDAGRNESRKIFFANVQRAVFLAETAGVATLLAGDTSKIRNESSAATPFKEIAPGVTAAGRETKKGSLMFKEPRSACFLELAISEDGSVVFAYATENYGPIEFPHKDKSKSAEKDSNLVASDKEAIIAAQALVKALE